MLLTLGPAQTDFEFKVPHGFASPPPSSRSPSLLSNGGSSYHPLPAKRTSDMSTHRGLPPPIGMALPDPSRGPPPPALPPSLGQMPAPPSQWQGAEESMRNWLTAKAEEERRRQEEEKTRQENLRLEQRKIEHAMLRDSMQGGVPAHLVPMIFAGIGGANLANVSLDWLQQYATQLQASQQQQQQVAAQTQPISPDSRREPRLINPPPPPPSYPIAPPVVIPHNPQAAQPGSFSPYPSSTLSPRSRAQVAPTSAPRPPPPPQSALPRLTTGDIQIQNPPTSQHHVPHTAHPLQSEPPSSSPSIYFHHWVPPTTQGTSGNVPNTPSDYSASPRKRKSQGPHPPPPPPTSIPQYTSPSFSHGSSAASTPGRRGHGRNRSDASRGEFAGRVGTGSRPHTASSVAESGFFAEPSSEFTRRRERSESGSQGSRSEAEKRRKVNIPTGSEERGRGIA
ncbi:hypothetical protein P152DRAFT_468659 [Eremomyces bilateralis CBS 781.70]|uniref:Uncharacterized protein n=1 Tax=Eremomyces bilateralis CBS 781.70 TaxID=1392243 RepID=A0A6G1FTD8_9PEZI|nr:uncharacterized protein P152DRAFT_468659 [Eremomyces bilateralis CBS 781.70]KAF1809057.1 hypothetical protein P152DRAFT_468659 [Eremomyces bilateralis CBS 781.70]